MNLNLDYTLYTDKERTAHIDQLLKDDQSAISQLINQYQTQGKEMNSTSAAGQSLEQIANYILFGKDQAKLTSAVQRKEINKPTTRYSTYKGKQMESLEEMLQQPGGATALEQQIAHQRNTYTHPKPTINNHYRAKNSQLSYEQVLASRSTNHPCPLASNCQNCTLTCYQTGADCDGAIPTMAQQWGSIRLFQQLIGIAAKKIPLPPNPTFSQIAASQWDSLMQYRVKHWLIDLRKHQYYLKDAYKPMIPCGFSSTKPGTIDWESDAGYYIGIDQAKAKGEYVEGETPIANIHGQPQVWHTVREHTLDLTNPNHIYNLLLLYDQLYKDSYEKLNGQMKWIIDALDEIGRRTQLTPAHDKILELRVLKWTNQRISQKIKEQFDLDHNPNYLSIIFKRNICGKLAQTAALMERQFAAANDQTKWKNCSCCGKRMLIDQYNFVRKSGTKDGFSARCKKCDADKRKQNGR